MAARAMGPGVSIQLQGVMHWLAASIARSRFPFPAAWNSRCFG